MAPALAHSQEDLDTTLFATTRDIICQSVQANIGPDPGTIFCLDVFTGQVATGYLWPDTAADNNNAFLDYWSLNLRSKDSKTPRVKTSFALYLSQEKRRVIWLPVTEAHNAYLGLHYAEIGVNSTLYMSKFPVHVFCLPEINKIPRKQDDTV